MLAAGGQLDPVPPPLLLTLHPALSELCPPIPVPPLTSSLHAPCLPYPSPPSHVLHDSGLFVGLRFPKGSSLQKFTPILVAPVPASFDFHLGCPPKGPDWQEWHRFPTHRQSRVAFNSS